MYLIIQKYPQMLVILGEYSLFLLVQFIYTLKPHSEHNRTMGAEISMWHKTTTTNTLQLISTTENISCPLMSSYHHSQKISWWKCINYSLREVYSYHSIPKRVEMTMHRIFHKWNEMNLYLLPYICIIQLS